MSTRMRPGTGEGLAREVGQSLALLALSGASVGMLLGVIALATAALGR